MSFINKLNDTYTLLSRLDDYVIRENGNGVLKKQLLSVSEDLTKYKNLDNQNIMFNNDEIKSKITDVLNKINEIESNVKNKLILTDKYNSYLNS